jgi:chromosome segregation protein
METQIAELRAKIEAMGPVNLVAIEEYQEHEERHEFLTRQRDDLVRSKQQLLDMIRRINETSSQMFTEAFEKINTNFQDIFTRFFDGGTARLVLVNEEDVLESGVEIIARPPGKRPQTVSLLSGGERTLTAVALLFAIYMIKPSPFCILDELDAALDQSNIGRFVDILHGFLDQSQFLVVTHNERTIAAADVLYGVTMVKNTGISRIVSIKFSDREKAGESGKQVSSEQTAGVSDQSSVISDQSSGGSEPLAVESGPSSVDRDPSSVIGDQAVEDERSVIADASTDTDRVV